MIFTIRSGIFPIIAAMVLLAGGCACGLAQPTKPRTPTTVDAPGHYGDWRSSRIGGGGYLQQVVFCPSDPARMYLSVDVGGLYRSDDAGRSWYMLHGALPARAGNYSVAGVSVHPRNADEVVIATGSRWAAPQGVYLTEDGGLSWRKTLGDAWFMGDGPHRADGPVLVREPKNPDILLAASVRDGVFRSEDGGRTWLNVGLKNVYPTAVVFDDRDARHVWLCGAEQEKISAWGGSVAFTGALYESRDRGLTWEKMADEAPREFVQDPVDSSRLYGIFDREQIKRSDDRGLTWSAFSMGLPLVHKQSDSRNGGRFRALATGPDFVLAGASNGTIYRLNRSRETWEPIERQAVEVGDWFSPSVEPMSRRFGAAMGCIAIDPRNPAHWCITDWYALYQTFDSANHWQLAIDGIEATVIHVLRSSPHKPGLIHLGMADNGYFRSTDDGQTFMAYPRGISNNIKDIAVSPANANRIYAVGPAGFGWRADQVFVSDDAGMNWRRAAMRGLPDMTKYCCNSVVAGIAGENEVWLAVSGPIGEGSGGVYHSTDAGQNWQWIGRGLPADHQFFRESIWGVGRELAVGCDGVLLCTSHADGKTFRLDALTQSWQVCASTGDGKPQDLMAGTDVGRFYLAMRDGGLSATSDHGRTWNRMYDKSVYFIAVDANTPRRLAAATDNGVIFSDDAGRSWRELDGKLPYRVARLPLCFAGDHLVVGTAGCGVFWMSLDKTAAGKQQ